METRDITIGEKTFKVRKKASYNLLNEISRLSIRISREEDIEKIADLQLKINETVLRRMVTDPIIDKTYLDEAGEEEFILSVNLAKEVAKLLTDEKTGVNRDLKKN